jgi:hypothetical protein
MYFKKERYFIMSTTKKNVTADKFDFKSVDNNAIAKLEKELAKLNYDFVVTKSDVTLFDVRPSHGELLANVGGLLSRCKGCSVWLTCKDVGVRLNAEHLERFESVASNTLESVTYKTDKRNVERRYSFNSLESATMFISSLVTAYNKSVASATKKESAKKESAKSKAQSKKRTTTKKESKAS